MLMNYLIKSRSIFVQGTVRFSVEDDQLFLSYTHNVHNIVIKKSVEWTKLEILRQIQDFCLDCYFDFEWDGKSLNLKDLSLLFGTSEGYVKIILNRIYKKLKIHEEQFLH